MLEAKRAIEKQSSILKPHLCLYILFQQNNKASFSLLARLFYNILIYFSAIGDVFEIV